MNSVETIAVKGLEHFTNEELFHELYNFITQEVNYVDGDFEITKLCLVGSRIKGTERTDSDLDVAFQYKGKYREDPMCDTLNMHPLYIDDFRVDFIPYSEFKRNLVDTNSPLIELPLLT